MNARRNPGSKIPHIFTAPVYTCSTWRGTHSLDLTSLLQRCKVDIVWVTTASRGKTHREFRVLTVAYNQGDS